MPSTYTTNLGIEKIATGEQGGTWGSTTNTNLDLIDEAVNGVVQVTLASAGSSGSPNGLPITNGTSSDGRNRFIEFIDGGDLGGTAFVQLTPDDAEKIVHIRNSLSADRSITIFQGTYNASNDFVIPNGADVVLKFDGAGAGAVVSDVFINLTPTKVTAADAAVDTLTLGGTEVTAGASELNILDGATVTTAELNILDGLTASAAELNKLDGFTGSVDDLNYAKDLRATGVTTTEFDKLDGLTPTTTELNYVDGVTSPIQTQLNAKAPIDNPSFTGDVTVTDKIVHSGDTNTAIRFPATDTVTVETAGTERMRIDSSGKVGIGATNPRSTLDLGNDSSGGRQISWHSSGIRSLGNIWTMFSSGSLTFGGGLKGSSTIANGFESSTSFLWSKTAISLTYGSIKFYSDPEDTVAYGAAYTPTERMRIDSSGNLLVGKSAVNFSTVGLQLNPLGASITNDSQTSLGLNRLTTDGSILTFYKNSALVGSISVTSSATAYNTSSDYRLKENVTEMADASSRVLALKPCRFNFITSPDATVDGFLAHEAQEVVPEAVTGTKDAMRTEEYEVEPAVYEDVIIPAEYDEEGNEVSPERTEKKLVTEAVMGTREVPDYQGIDQSKLVPLLTKALQEALTEIENLKQRVSALESTQ